MHSYRYNLINQGGLYEGAYAVEAARRYKEIWLPLLAKTHENVQLIPPLDIAFAGYIHKLNPTAYQADMTRLGIRQSDSKGQPWPIDPFDFTDGVVADNVGWTSYRGSHAFVTISLWAADIASLRVAQPDTSVNEPFFPSPSSSSRHCTPSSPT